MANWNNKAATADEGNNFGRLCRHIFILERLAAENAWDRDQAAPAERGRRRPRRQGRPRPLPAAAPARGGRRGRQRRQRRRSTRCSRALEAHQAAPDFGRFFIDPVQRHHHRRRGRLPEPADQQPRRRTSTATSSAARCRCRPAARALSMVQHAIDSAAGDLPGGYAQAYAGDYFDGQRLARRRARHASRRWRRPGIPADAARPMSRYRHPLAALLPALELRADAAGQPRHLRADRRRRPAGERRVHLPARPERPDRGIDRGR